MEFQLFRIQVHPAEQPRLWDPKKSRSEILRDTVLSLPSVELRRGKTWHIGNVEQVDQSGFYFRVGRISKSTLQVWDSGNFIDAEFESAPYTHVVLDIDLEVCAIAKKPKLAPTARGIAGQFSKLLNGSPVAEELGVRFETSALSDPEDFIQQMQRARAIIKFWITFSRPNAWDAADFVIPMQKLLEESNGHSGKTEIQGKDLDETRLEELTRSAAASGNNAAVVMYESEGTKVSKQLIGNSAVLTQNELADSDDRHKLLKRMRSIYSRIRRKDQADS
jgi:hypothetical protein